VLASLLGLLSSLPAASSVPEVTGAAITARCRRDFYPAAHDSGTRSLDAIRWIVLHSTEGGTAASVARYFAQASAAGSAHLVVDDDGCQRCLPDNAIPWAAPGANLRGWHVEQCGYAAWTRAQWLAHRATLERSAEHVAWACERFKIPATFRTAAGLRAERPGITTHAQCTLAFGPPGGHTDPGSGWPRDVFMTLVRSYL
jgi:hypothetical protein